LVAAGTVSGDSFLWAWANDSIPAVAKASLEHVRQFGLDHDLSLLTEPCAPGGLSQGKECLAIAARLLDANGIWFDRTEDGSILFAVRDTSHRID
jgi:hypothetical protein